VSRTLYENMEDRVKILTAKAVSIPSQVDSISEAEFSVFSQWGDDGIIQFLVKHVGIRNDFFVEFGVENYAESNTRFLMMNNNWSGFVMDGSKKNVSAIQDAHYFWKYDLQAKSAFVTKQNIIELLREHCPDEIGLLHIDIDGVDYWIWKEIGRHYKPDIVVLEYNSIFGADRSITVPYKSEFNRFDEHYSGLYAGASLKALYQLSESYGYSFLGCNSAGNNAYFVLKELINEHLPMPDLHQGFVESKFRESRDKKGKLSYIRGKNRIEVIQGMPVFNTETQKTEAL